MRVTMDRAGRIVIPKELRDHLHLHGGSELEVDVFDDHLELSVPPVPMHLELRDGVLVAVPEGEIPTLTTEMVRETLERIRR